MSSLRRKRPRIGCVVLSLVAVPALSALLAAFVSTLPPPSPMPREAVRPSYEAERGLALEMGFRLERELEAELPRHEPAYRAPLALAADECVAVVAALDGYQTPRTLELARQGGQRVAVSTSEPGQVAHVQWCSEQAESLEIAVHRAAADPYRRDGHLHASLQLAILRAPSATIGGLRRLRRGASTDDELRRMTRRILEAADAQRPAGRLLAELRVESFEARLIPEDAATYGELHRGAANGSSTVVSPRFAPLPDGVPAGWRPIRRTADELRRAVRPSDAPSGPHPAVREADQGMRRVLAVVDADRLGSQCVELQWVRELYGRRAAVERARAGERASTALRSVDNVALDRRCRGDGSAVYVVAPTDQERYLLRVYEASR